MVTAPWAEKAQVRNAKPKNIRRETRGALLLDPYLVCTGYRFLHRESVIARQKIAPYLSHFVFGS
jgi:hypothetical protein